MTHAPELLGRAVARGLVPPGAVLAGRVRLVEQSRSNLVHRLDLDGRPVAFVKRRGAAAALDRLDPVGTETLVLSALAGLDVVPSLAGGPDGAAVWTRAVDGIPLYAVHGTTAHLLAVARAWGASLAQLHRWPVGTPAVTLAAGAPRVERPWALAPDALPASMGRPEPGSALARVLDAARSPWGRAAIRLVEASWHDEAWLHGDLGAANVLVAGAGAEPVVRLIDLEAAGLGPACWDLAAALDTLGGLVRTWGEPGVIGAFVGGYRSAGGPGRVQPAHLAVRALVTGWQSAAGLLGRGDEAGAHTEARIHVQRARHWAERLHPETGAA